MVISVASTVYACDKVRAGVLFRYIGHISPNPYHMISGGDVWDGPPFRPFCSKLH